MQMKIAVSLILVALFVSSATAQNTEALINVKTSASFYPANFYGKLIDCDGFLGPALCYKYDGTFNSREFDLMSISKDKIIFTRGVDSSLAIFLEGRTVKNEPIMISLEDIQGRTRPSIEEIPVSILKTLESASVRSYALDVYSKGISYKNVGKKGCESVIPFTPTQYFKLKSCSYSDSSGTGAVHIETTSGFTFSYPE